MAKQFALDTEIFSSGDPVLSAQLLESSKAPMLFVVKASSFKPQRMPGHDFTSRDALSKWVQDNRFPMVVTLNSANAREIFGRKMYIVLTFLDPDSAEFSALLQKLKEIAKEMSGPSTDVMFAWIDGVAWANYAYHAFRIDKSMLPMTLIIHPNGDEFYSRDQTGELFKVEKVKLVEALAEAKEGKLHSTTINGGAGGSLVQVCCFNLLIKNQT